MRQQVKRDSQTVPMQNDIVFINIDCENNYFDTQEQIDIKNKIWFTESTPPSVVSGSNTAIGFFSRQRIVKSTSGTAYSPHATGSTIVDPSGAQRKILALNVDTFSSSSVDGYRNGVEISEDKHWTAGLAKITAGTPGHLYQKTLFGVPSTSIIDPDKFIELSKFNPVQFVESGGETSNYTYPIITADYNQLENYNLDGIIEPFPIRSVISNFSINFPFEPHSIKGSLCAGNSNMSFRSDMIVSVDYFEPDRNTRSFFLDAAETTIFHNDDFTASASLGPSFGYVNLDENYVAPFQDVVYPRDEIPNSTYTGDLLVAVNKLPISGSSYVSRKQKTATCGFVYDDTVTGTDSIAYGGLMH